MINNYYDMVNGLFGIQTLKLEIQNGRMNGEVKKEKWRLITRKDRSRRYGEKGNKYKSLGLTHYSSAKEKNILF